MDYFTRRTAKGRAAIAEYVEQRKLTAPRKLVLDAQRKTSPLHKLFDWNKDRAAWEHWLDEARDILRSVRVEVTTTSTKLRIAPRAAAGVTPVYVHDPKGRRPGYTKLEGLRGKRTVDVIRQEAAVLRGLLSRFVGVAEAVGRHDLAKQVSPMVEYFSGLALTATKQRKSAAA